MNTFDNLSIKINKLFEYKNYKKKSISKGFVFKFLSRYLIGLLILTKVYEKLIPQYLGEQGERIVDIEMKK